MADEQPYKPWDLIKNDSGYHYLTPDNTWETIRPTPGATYSPDDYKMARDFAKQQWGQGEPSMTKLAQPTPAQPDQPILQRLNALASRTGGSIGGLIGGSLVPQQYAQTGESVGRSIGSAIGGGVVPSSYPEVAALAASMVQPELLGLKALGPLAKMAYRVAAPALAAGTTAAVTGEEPVPAAATAAIGSGAAEAGGLAVRGSKWASQTLTSGPTIQKEIHNFSNGFLNAIKGDVPWLSSVTKDLPTLRMNGKQVLSSEFDKMDKNIVQEFGKDLMTVPVFDVRSGRTLNARIPAEEAAQLLKTTKAAADKAPQDALGFAIRERATEMEKSYIANLARKDAQLKAKGVNSDLVGKYDEARQQYQKGLRVMELVKRPGTTFADEQGAAIHPIGVAANMNKQMEVYTADKFPNMWAMASRGGPIGALDVLSKKGVHAYVPGTHIGANIPLGTQYKLAGKEVPPILKSGKVQPLADLLGIKGAFGLNNQE